MVKHTQTICGPLPTNCLSVLDHFLGLALRVNKKLNDIHHITSYMSLGQRKFLLRALTESQFSYSPLTWMFHSETQSYNKNINRLLEKELRIVYED